MSGSFVKLLSAQIRCVRTQTFLGPSVPASRADRGRWCARRRQCRKIDQVKVVGSDKVTELWTRDVPLIQDRVFMHAFHVRSPRPAARGRPTPAHRGRAQPQAAERAYIAGQWNEAMTHLHKCRSRIPGDGPTTAMIGAIEDLGEHSDGVYFAPPRWPGYRKLQSK